MSETIKGILQEITVKKGKSKSGKAYTLFGVKVDDTLYGTGFEKVKAASGDTVTFDFEENDRGYNEIEEGTFKVVKKATSEESAAVSKANAAGEVGKQSSIENQTILNNVTALTVSLVNTVEGFDGDSALKFAERAFKTFSGLLHPAAAPAPKAKAKPPVEEEEEDEAVPY